MGDKDIYILHEMQDSALCGQHCLNNLVQQCVFNTLDLAEIAQELDRMEIECLGGETGANIQGNVDNSGNFSFSVLAAALKRSFDIELVSWTGSEGREQLDITKEKGFIINADNHWYTIRKIGDHWWNLDSFLQRPQRVSPLYLEMYLSELRSQGCMIFLARGAVPPGGVYGYNINDFPNSIWYLESDLLKSTGKRNREGVVDLTNDSAVSRIGNVMSSCLRDAYGAGINAAASLRNSLVQPFVVDTEVADGANSNAFDASDYDAIDADLMRQAIEASLQSLPITSSSESKGEGEGSNSSRES